MPSEDSRETPIKLAVALIIFPSNTTFIGLSTPKVSLVACTVPDSILTLVLAVTGNLSFR
jgi:hypothetical protein